MYSVIGVCVHPVGFEPTPPKRTELESVALDHSATGATKQTIYLFCSLVRLCERERDTRETREKKMRDNYTLETYA